MTPPILYSFRRCPYAMRARLAIASAGITCELREIVLRDKAPDFLATSATGTVPLLVNGGEAIEESLDIMLWALGQNDPEGWLCDKQAALRLIETADGDFKSALDRYKYATRYVGVDPADEREKASLFLQDLEFLLARSAWLTGPSAGLADMAILPFVRQFAFVDKPWFDAQPWPNLARWLDQFLASDRFAAIVQKYPKWAAGDPVTLFPPL